MIEASITHQPTAEHKSGQEPAWPSVSVVIAWVNPLELLSPGLEVLATSGSVKADEIVVVTRRGSEDQLRLKRGFPGVSLLVAPASTSIPALRSIGIRHANGDVIAITEDHCVPGANWIATIKCRMLDRNCLVVGGPVENASTERLRDWAAFLTEYAGAIRPAVSSPGEGPLPGNNVAYRRTVIDGLVKTLERGQWESFYHEQLTREGTRLLFDPELLVLHQRPFDVGYFVGQRFVFSRSYAAMRNQSLTPAGRLKYGLGSLLLPPLLLARGLATLIRRRRLVGRYLVCLPLITLYVSVGAVGEIIGYLFGGANSLEQIE
jgi:hypothetical protein